MDEEEQLRRRELNLRRREEELRRMYEQTPSKHDLEVLRANVGRELITELVVVVLIIGSPLVYLTCLSGLFF